MQPRDWIGIAVILGFVFGLLISLWEGWLALTLVVEAILGVVGSIVVVVVLWSFAPRIWKLKERLAPDTTETKTGTLSEDRKAEILERHRKTYVERVLTPLSRYSPGHASHDGKYRGESEPWDHLYASYDPASMFVGSTHLEAFSDHLRGDLQVGPADLRNFAPQTENLRQNIDSWRKTVTEAAAVALAPFGPVDRTGELPSGPFVSLGGAERALIRAWRDEVYQQVEAATYAADPKVEWPPATRAFPVWPGVPDMWICGGWPVGRLVQGKSIEDWQNAMADLLASRPLFDRYVALRRRGSEFVATADRLRERARSAIDRFERGDYVDRWPCCKRSIEWPGPGTSGA